MKRYDYIFKHSDASAGSSVHSGAAALRSLAMMPWARICPGCWICGDSADYKLLQLRICIYCVCVSVCVYVCDFSRARKTNTAGSPAPPPLCWLQMRVFQMNNTRREMTNSRRDERLNMWEPESKMGFISSMWRCALEPIKRGRRDSLLFLLLLLLLFCSWCSEAALRRTGLAV